MAFIKLLKSTVYDVAKWFQLATAVESEDTGTLSIKQHAQERSVKNRDTGETSYHGRWRSLYFYTEVGS